MSERQQCNFFLIQYVPDPIRNEFVNIGILLRSAEKPDQTVVRFTHDWARVRCADPDVDVAMLEALEGELQRQVLEPSGATKPIWEIVEDSFSNTIQVTGSKAFLAESVISGAEELMRLYVEPRKRQETARRSGRQAVYTKMRSHFERAGAWDLMRKRIAISGYTKPGDPLRIDCGYRPNGVVRMFHAISLGADSDLPKVLAFSAEAIRKGVARVEGAALELTAIVEPIAEVSSDREDVDRIEQYRFAVETMEAEHIRVLTTSDLSRVAETARRELRV